IVLDARDLAWTVLLPKCDGDVFNQQGIRVFDRMLTGAMEIFPQPKSVLGVWGANHNFFNTEWQETDSVSCSGRGHRLLATDRSGKLKQLGIGFEAMRQFFLAHLDGEHSGNPDFFNPAFPLSK